MRKVVFVVQLPQNVSPGQRFRCEQYEELMKANGFWVETFSFFDNDSHKILYKQGFLLKKVIGVIKGLFRRFYLLFKLRNYNYIFLQREFAPIGPPVFEWIASRLLRVKIIYDFDDAIWIPNVSAHNRLAASLKAFWKVKYICRWSYKVSVGNHYLAKWASQYNSNIVYNPTCVDMQSRYNIVKEQESGTVVIGWTGSHSTLRYLELVKPVLEELEQEYNFQFLIICDQPPAWKIKSLRFVPWKEETEIDDLLKMNIGIMPLEQDAWSEGKCGFKLIQYLALGIPAVASPVGVNQQIIVPGTNGYLCNTGSEWKTVLVRLLQDAALRKTLGMHGREKMFNEFSTQSNEHNFLALFS